jgi:phosphoacetylglucosamine mutase
MQRLCFRVGIVIAMKAKQDNLAGLMVTASHNPKEDNGVKIIESNGNTLELSWEPLAEKIVNSKDLRKTLEEIDSKEMRQKYNIKNSIFNPNNKAHAFFGMDTRSTSPMLCYAAYQACQIMGVQGTELGLCSTPQLHWLISNKTSNKMDYI